jgi:hypothetical protein
MHPLEYPFFRYAAAFPNPSLIATTSSVPCRTYEVYLSKIKTASVVPVPVSPLQLSHDARRCLPLRPGPSVRSISLKRWCSRCLLPAIFPCRSLGQLPDSAIFSGNTRPCSAALARWLRSMRGCRDAGSGRCRGYSLAIVSSTSAWHGLFSGHQQAKSFPRSSSRIAAIPTYPPVLINSWYKSNA